MTWPRPGARRLIGAGLLLPGLLLSHPLDTAAETSTVKTPPKRTAAKELPPKTPRPKAPPAKKLAAKTQPVKSPPAKTPLVQSQPVKKGKAGASAATPSPDERCVHLVRRGDTVFRVAAQYRVPRQGIITGNQLGAAGTLKVGQRISVPGCKKGGSLRAEARVRRPPWSSRTDSFSPASARTGYRPDCSSPCRSSVRRRSSSPGRSRGWSPRASAGGAWDGMPASTSRPTWARLCWPPRRARSASAVGRRRMVGW